MPKTKEYVEFNPSPELSDNSSLKTTPNINVEQRSSPFWPGYPSVFAPIVPFVLQTENDVTIIHFIEVESMATKPLALQRPEKNIIRLF